MVLVFQFPHVYIVLIGFSKSMSKDGLDDVDVDHVQYACMYITDTRRALAGYRMTAKGILVFLNIYLFLKPLLSITQTRNFIEENTS